MGTADSLKQKKSQWLPAAADVRGNLVRMIAILGFYAVHLLNYFLPALGESAVRTAVGLKGPSVSGVVHLAVSILVFAWLLQAMGVHLASMTRPLTRKLALAVIVGDVVWLTAALCFSTGAAGPMVAGYFLILGLSALRLDLRLIRWATVATCFGYLFVLGATRWPVGLLKEIQVEAVPRYHQIMTIVALILMGVVLGQVVRLAWGIVASHRRVELGGQSEVPHE
ncbi:hypothetical protein [Mariniblastus fucicola]|uniref:Uncharacterized protein n=1 Tax=Mariniblastus fucicola TaxID=980251 RepID=A0A5B9PAT9_9BACT|nr:hypothetical protein [Mariniblastus fucicola]QEG20223.1 hypothetical protein MFFC18_00700 [Mariniblastus fucicola]